MPPQLRSPAWPIVDCPGCGQPAVPGTYVVINRAEPYPSTTDRDTVFTWQVATSGALSDLTTFYRDVSDCQPTLAPGDPRRGRRLRTRRRGPPVGHARTHTPGRQAARRRRQQVRMTTRHQDQAAEAGERARAGSAGGSSSGRSGRPRNRPIPAPDSQPDAPGGFPAACLVPGGPAGGVRRSAGWSRAGWFGGAGSMEAGLAVQQESTATGPDCGGLVRTSWDGGLRRWTVVDALPADGMQEVRGSNPHSSTGKSDKSKSWPEIFCAVQQQKYSSART
jgi:hypothetical protein